MIYRFVLGGLELTSALTTGWTVLLFAPWMMDFGSKTALISVGVLLVLGPALLVLGAALFATTPWRRQGALAAVAGAILSSVWALYVTTAVVAAPVDEPFGFQFKLIFAGGALLAPVAGDLAAIESYRLCRLEKLRS